MKDRTEEIKQELSELHNTLKMSVQKAIRIGELLTEQKAFVGHGQFLPWLDMNFDMGERTARRYMAVFAYRSKTDNLADLSEAYRQIETIEAQEKAAKTREQMSADERYRSMVGEFKKTGIAPLGWSRDFEDRMKKSDENYKKFQAEQRQAQKDREEADRLQRVKEADEKRESYSEPSPEPQQQSSGSSNVYADAFKVVADTFIKHTNERNAWKEKIRLSDGGKEDAFMDAIIDYLETLPNDNRRIEACNNLIKICRNIAVELQKNNLAA